MLIHFIVTVSSSFSNLVRAPKTRDVVNIRCSASRVTYRRVKPDRDSAVSRLTLSQRAKRMKKGASLYEPNKNQSLEDSRPADSSRMMLQKKALSAHKLSYYCHHQRCNINL